MGRRLDRLTLDNLGDLPQEAQSCVFWELDQVQRARSRGREIEEKRAWLSEVLRDWGSCGRILYVDEDYAGHVIWAPGTLLPGAANFATAPPSPDAVLVASAFVDPGHRRHGLGRVLVQAMAKDVWKHHARGGTVRAIEAFGAERPRAGDCVLPVDFWLAVGFATHRAHPSYPRLRMDLRSTVTWREEVGHALERLTGGVKQPAGQALRRGEVSVTTPK
jgi:GNAT superfamily N-acetyltransferase